LSQFYEAFRSLSTSERERIATEAGLTPGYVSKHLYSSADRVPKFHFPNAVALDKASDGAFSFLEITAGSDIDWDYVFRRLMSAKRRGLI
jgi:hypothetical protein